MAVSETDKHLSYLRRGAERAVAVHGEQATHTHVVWEAIRESLELVEKTDDQEKRWLSSGSRCSLASLQGMNLQEAFELELAQMMDAMGAPQTKVDERPKTGDHDYMLDVLGWLQFCRTTNDPDNRLGKVAVMIIRGSDHNKVAKVYGRPVSRALLSDMRRIRIPRAILRGLRETYRIVPGEGLSFVEEHP